MVLYNPLMPEVLDDPLPIYRQLRGLLESGETTAPEDVPLDEADREALRALGYVQ